MNLGYKEESFNQKNHKLKRSGNRLLTGFLLTFVLGYFFFFTSNIWMPSPYEGVEITPFGTPVESNQRTITIDSWTYSEEDRKMEIIVSIENMAIDGIKRYKWNVKTASGNLSVDTIMETDKLVVLQVNNTPKRWTELALTMNVKKEDQRKTNEFAEIKVYTNDKHVKNVAHIYMKSPTEYQKEAILSRIESYQEQLAEELSKQKKVQTEIQNIVDKMKELKESMDYQTEQEQAETTETIHSFMDDKDNLDNELAEIGNNISELKEKIEIQNKLLKEL